MNDSWGDDFLDPEELHRRLAAAVAPVKPNPDSLERLRGRVTARRRQRQAMTMGGAAVAVTGMALTAVLVGPAATDQADDPGAGPTGSSAAGTAAGDNTSQQAAGARTWPGRPPDGHPAPPPTGSQFTALPSASPSTTGPSGPATAKQTAGPAAVPACKLADLHKTDKAALASKAEGGVGYGYLEFANGSATSCSVTGPPKASVVDASSGADAGFATTRRSATESPALADVPSWGRTLVLKPKETYRFQFAWTNKTATEGGAPCAGPDSTDTTKTWAVRYALTAGGPALAQVALPVACKGTLYETDVYRPGEYSESFG